MKNQFLSHWNNRRAWHVALGSIVIIHSIILGEWPGIQFGAYFAAMSIFSFGCAAGNCRANYTSRHRATPIVDAEFEEIK